MSVVLDTTVLVYAVGDNHALREPAAALLEAVASGRIRATTTPEVLQEFAHVRARRRDRDDAARLTELYADLLAPLIEVGEEDLREGMRLFRTHDEIGAFDAVLAATALRRRSVALVSADKSFGAISVLPFNDLAGLDLDALA